MVNKCRTWKERIHLYELESHPFRLEVPSGKCEPSIATFPHSNAKDFLYIAASPLVMSDGGFSGAGSYDQRDILWFDSGRPRPIDNPAFGENVFDSAQQVRDDACKEFYSCPLGILAFRTYWKFSGDEKFTFTAKYVDFKRITEDRSLNDFKGAVLLMVYTKVKDASTKPGDDSWAYRINIMETHPIVIFFK